MDNEELKRRREFFTFDEHSNLSEAEFAEVRELEELASPSVLSIAPDLKPPTRGWIQTFSGDQAWPLDMEKTNITIEDIAHSLAMKVRFTGHCIEQYSIAQHCIHVANLVPEEDRREALMHDAAEYVLPDVATPIKAMIPGFKEIEKRVERVLAERFTLRFPNPPSVKLADNAMVLFERDRIMRKPKYPDIMLWDIPGEPANIPDFRVLPWQVAELLFLEAADRLGIK